MKTVLALVGVMGSLASVVALWPVFREASSADGGRVEVRGRGNAVNQGSGNIYQNNNYGDAEKEVRAFKKFVPATYLTQLPRVRYNAYMAAHRLWDTGITSEAMQGNEILRERLRELLHTLAQTAYTPDFFGGETVPEYYDGLLARLEKAAEDAQPEDGGTMHVLMADGARARLIEDCIVKIVRDVTPEGEYVSWEAKWDRAGKAGAEGRQVDVDLADF